MSTHMKTALVITAIVFSLTLASMYQNFSAKLPAFQNNFIFPTPIYWVAAAVLMLCAFSFTKPVRNIEPSKENVDELRETVNAQSTQIQEINNEIKQREKLLLTVNSLTEILLAEAGGKDKGAITPVLELIGRCMEADRVQIWRNETVDNELCSVRIYQWLSEEGRRKSIIPMGMNVPSRSCPEWEEKLMRGENINTPVSLLSKKEQGLFRSFDTKSIIVIPIFVKNKFWGCLNVDDCRRERFFSGEEIDVLYSAARMIAGVVSDFPHDEKYSSTGYLDDIGDVGPITTEIWLDNGQIRENGVENKRFLVFDNYNFDYNVRELINDAVNQNIAEIGDKPVRFILNIDEGLPSVIHGDELRIRQIISSLLSNAFKYTENGTVILSVGSVRDGSTVWLSVHFRDTGIGIPPEKRRELFGDYTREKDQYIYNHNGTELKLFAAKRLVEMMNGTFAVESEHGKGSVFMVMIPQKMAGAETIMDSCALEPNQKSCSDSGQKGLSTLENQASNQKRIAFKRSGLTVWDRGTEGNETTARSEMLISGIPCLEIKKLLECFDGKEDECIETLRTYASTVSVLLDSMKMINYDNLPELIDIIHQIREAGSVVGADKIGAMADALEKAASTGDIAAMVINKEIFLDDVWKLVFSINETLFRTSMCKSKQKRDKPGQEILLRLLEACTNNNMDEVVSVMEEIDGNEYEEENGLISWVKEKVEEVNSAQIAAMLSVIKEENEKERRNKLA